MTKQVYVSGALTGIANPDGVKAFYENIGKVCEKLSWQPYVPHLVSDPIKNPTLTPRDVYQLDRQQVSRADLLIAYVGIPSLGVGAEIEIAREYDVPVVLLMEQHVSVSRMIRGNPAVVAELKFTDFSDALNQLSAWLGKQSTA